MIDYSQIKKAAVFGSIDDIGLLTADFYDFMLKNEYNHVLITNADFAKMCHMAIYSDDQLETMDIIENEKYFTYYNAFVNCHLYRVTFVEGTVVLGEEVNLPAFFNYLLSKNKYNKINYDLDFIGITKKYVKHL